MICTIQCSNSKRYLLPLLFFLFLFFFYPFFCKTGNTISRPRTKSVYYSKSYKVLTKLPTTSYNINPDPFRSAIRQVGKKKLSDFLERKQTKERNWKHWKFRIQYHLIITKYLFSPVQILRSRWIQIYFNKFFQRIYLKIETKTRRSLKYITHITGHRPRTDKSRFLHERRV